MHPQGINAKIDTNRVVYDSDASTRFEFEVMLVFCMYMFCIDNIFNKVKSKYLLLNLSLLDFVFIHH